jgi:MFS family permease
MNILQELRRTLALGVNIRIMALRALITEACFGMFYVVWQPYVIELGATLPQLGLVQGVMMLFAAVGSLAWGRLSDAWGRKPAAVGSIVCRAVALVFCFVARDWVSFVGFGVFMGLSASWQQNNPAISALMAESVDEERVGTAISVIMSLGMMASISTASLGGYLALKDGYRIIFLSCIAGEMFNTVLYSTRLRETLDRDALTAKPAEDWLRGLAEFLRPEASLLPFYVAAVIGSVSNGMSNSILYGLLVDSFGFNTVQLGLMSTLFGLSWGLSQMPVGWLMDRFGKKPFLLLSQIASMAVMAGYFLSRDFAVFLLLQAVSGLGHAMWIPAQIAIVTERIPAERRSSAMGKLSTFPMLFSIPAPYLGGLIYEAFGFGAPMLIRLFSLVVSFVIILVFVKEAS